MKWRAVLACGIACAAAASVDLADAAANDAATTAAVAWAAQHAVPLSGNLGSIDSVVGNARVFALGEGTHNVHEFWILRNQLFEYAVEQLGFTAIAAETGYAQALATDDYVQGRDVDSTAAARGVFSWSTRVFEENYELINWMRAHNALSSVERKVHFYGLEMAGTLQPDGRSLVRPALGYLASVDPEGSKVFTRRLEPLLSQFNAREWSKLTPVQQDATLVAVQDLVSLFDRMQILWVAKTSSGDFQRAYRHAVAARQLVASFRMDDNGRDIAAADNLRWVLEREGPQGRVFVFAHNSHVAKWRIPPDDIAQVHSSMGEFANAMLGRDFVVIASLYDRGETRDWLGFFDLSNQQRVVGPSAPGSLNGVMARVGPAQFFLNLHNLPPSGVVTRWFAEPRALRNINAADEYQREVAPSASFDALIFIRDITPLRPRG